MKKVGGGEAGASVFQSQGTALLEELQHFLPERVFEPSSSELWVRGGALQKVLGGVDRREQAVEPNQISMSAVRRGKKKKKPTTKTIGQVAKRWQEERTLDPSLFASLEATRVLLVEEWEALSANLHETDGAALEPLLRLARYEPRAWQNAFEQLLSGPVTDLTFFSNSNPLWSNMPDELRQQLSSWVGQRLGKIPKESNPASTTLYPDKVAKLLFLRCMDLESRFGKLAGADDPAETKKAYLQFLADVKKATRRRKTVGFDRIMQAVHIAQEALSHPRLHHVEEPVAYLFGSTASGLARPKRSDTDIVFEENYFQYYYDKGEGGMAIKSEVDGQIFRALDRIDPRPLSDPDVFATTSIFMTPEGFAVTSPIMLKIEKDRVSLVLFPSEYTNGQNRMEDEIFMVDPQSRPITLRLE